MLDHLTRRSREASRRLLTLATEIKNAVLEDAAERLLSESAAILGANALDVRAAERAGLKPAMVDRLRLDEGRLAGMARAVRDIAVLPDPVGEVVESYERNGLKIRRVRIPLGVILMIYEARPNVTSDSAALCFKAGNAVILRGGSEAFRSNRAIARVIRTSLKARGVDENAVTLVPVTDRGTLKKLLARDDGIDLVVPRGGEGLMRFVRAHSKIPVVKHDKGVCSIFVDESADLARAVDVVDNAKTQRPGVCNALETLYVHEAMAGDFLPQLASRLASKGVELRGDAATRRILPGAKRATPADFATEYLDLILAVKIVKDVDDAIACIRKYYSRHTESILTENPANAGKFLDSLDSSCVMVNTSTRFNDGGELGLGAELGISTTKLHAYGPMGLRELTIPKFLVESDYRTR